MLAPKRPTPVFTVGKKFTDSSLDHLISDGKNEDGIKMCGLRCGLMQTKTPRPLLERIQLRFRVKASHAHIMFTFN